MTFRELLRDKDFTQTRLSQIAGVSQSNLSIYCNYRDRLEASSELTREKIAMALEMSLEDFEAVLILKPSQILASNKQKIRY